MANQKIDVEIAFTGADKARTQMEGLADSTDGFSQSLANVSAEELKAAQKLESLERAEARLRSKLSNNAGFQQHIFSLRQAQSEADRLARAEAMAARELEIAQKRADLAADAFLRMVGAEKEAADGSASLSSKVGAATSSIGGMISVVGAGNPAMAQLGGIMSVVGSAASQMGQSMDPVSVTISVMTIAISALAAGMDHLAEQERQLVEENNALERSYQDLAQEISNTLSTTARVQRNMQGLGTEIEATAQLRHLESLQTVTQRELDQYLRQRNELSGLQRTFGGEELDRLDSAIALRQQTLVDLRAGIAGARLGVEAARDTQIAETIEDTFDAAENAARRRSGGRGNRVNETLEMLRRAEEEAAAAAMVLENDMLAALGDEADQHSVINDLLNERLSTAQLLVDEEKRMMDEQRRAQEAADEAWRTDETRVRLAREHLAEIEKEEELRQEAANKTRADINEIGADAAGIASDIFRLALSGQEDLGAAFQAYFSDLMIQKGSEAVFDGTKALFEAVGFAATGNAPAAAGKAAEGAGLIALGVAAGAVGAAIAPPAGGAAERPRSEPTPDQGGGGTTVINFDSPLAIVGDERTVAMQLNATINRGTGRQLTPGRRAA